MARDAWVARVGTRPLAGDVPAIASKSAAHRLLILAALADAPTHLACATTSRDIQATAACLAALGAVVTRVAGGYDVTPIPRDADGALPAAARGATLDCGESGSTLRFMLPVALALGADATLDGRGRLPERPLSPLRELLQARGCAVSAPGAWPLRTAGRLEVGDCAMRGDVSSQFATGLMLAAAARGRGARVTLTPPVESRPYLDLTRDCLAQFGVATTVTDGEDGSVTWDVAPLATPRTPGVVAVEGDWSNAAFWLAAGAIGARPVTVRGLRMDSPQGDRAVCELLARFGARVREDAAAGAVTVAPGELRGVAIDAADIPDLVVPMAVVAACACGETRVVNAARLRAKESDRLATVAELLRDLGAEVAEGPDWLTIQGRGDGTGADACLRGCVTDAHNDHRIAMAAAVAATRADDVVTITGAQAVRKSYPTFFDDYRRLGGAARVDGADPNGAAGEEA